LIYGDFKIFGSSPEAQFDRKRKARLKFTLLQELLKEPAMHEQDAELAKKLKIDDKENSEPRNVG